MTATTRSNAARWYTLASGVFLLAQGASTLAARVFGAVDRAVPWLLDTTRMVESHSVVHLATGFLALGALAWGGEKGPVWFSFGFGAFYIALGLVGAVSGLRLGLGLQPFDHSFHLLLGGLGLLAGWLTSRSTRQETARP